MMAVRIPRGVVIALAVAAAAVAWWVYSTFDPSTHFFPRCMFHELTGWECPGCGSQRALHALLTGDVAGAWHFNALFVLELPLLVLLVAAWYMRSRVPWLHRTLNSRSVILGILAVIILWTIVRNL